MKNTTIILTAFLLNGFISQAQLGLLEVEGEDSAAINIQSPSYLNSTSLNLLSGELNNSFTHYTIRNENDLLNIDAHSDFNNEPNEQVVTINIDGTIRSKSYICPNSITQTSLDGCLRFQNDRLEVFANGDWNQLAFVGPPSCDNFAISYPTINQSFSQQFSIDLMNRFVVTVNFSEAVDVSTLVNSNTFIVSNGGFNLPGSLLVSSDGLTATWTSTNSFLTFCSFNPDCLINFQLIGTDNGNGAIQNLNGCNLDGDLDGNEGGNFTTIFGILG